MLAHIGGTSSKGSCTVWTCVGRETLSLTLLQTVVFHEPGVQECSSPLARSVLSHQQQVVPALPSRTSTDKQRQGGTARDAGTQGCRDAGMRGCEDAGTQICKDAGIQECSHPLPAHCSEGGEDQEAAELCQLLGNSPANLYPVRNHFFQLFRWISQAQDQALLTRWF